MNPEPQRWIRQTYDQVGRLIFQYVDAAGTVLGNFDPSYGYYQHLIVPPIERTDGQYVYVDDGEDTTMLTSFPQLVTLRHAPRTGSEIVRVSSPDGLVRRDITYQVYGFVAPSRCTIA